MSLTDVFKTFQTLVNDIDALIEKEKEKVDVELLHEILNLRVMLRKPFNRILDLHEYEKEQVMLAFQDQIERVRVNQMQNKRVAGRIPENFTDSDANEKEEKNKKTSKTPKKSLKCNTDNVDAGVQAVC